MKEAYAQGLDSEEDEDSVGDQIKPKDVGHNIYILAHQVTRKTGCFSITARLSDLLLTSGQFTGSDFVCVHINAPIRACPLC